MSDSLQGKQSSSPNNYQSPPARNITRKKLYVVTIATFLIATFLGITLVLVAENNRLKSRQKTVNDILVQIADNIQDQLNRSLSATFALAAVIRQNNGRIDNFESLATEMIGQYGGISCLQLAPKGIISATVPLAGNEKAIGHNLLEDSKRNKEALLALKTRTLTLAGPFELIQGGQAVVGRLPVFIPVSGGGEYFWGFTAALIRIPELIDSAKIQKVIEAGYNFEISRIHPDSGKLDIFASSSKEALRSPVQHDILVPNGSWTLSVEPQNGWFSPITITLELVLVILFGSLIAKIVHTFYKQPIVLQQMVDERTLQLSESNRKLKSEIEERARTEAALRNSEENYRILINSIPLGINLIDTEHRIIMVNSTTAKWLRRPTESLIGQYCFEQFEKRDHICSHCPGELSIKYGQAAITETVAIRDDGTSFNASIHTVPLYDIQGATIGFIEIVEDITERKKAEDALRKSEARLNESQKVAHLGHYELDISSGTWTNSSELDAILGIDAGFTRDVPGWHQIIHHEDREDLSTYLRDHVMRDRLTFNREYRICRISDQTIRWVHGLGDIELDADNNLVKMFGTIQDITERKLAEENRNKLEQQMQHAQKLESLGVLAGGIAHDFNNILMAILGHAELALIRLSPASPARENLASIEEAAQRAADLSRQMLAYSGKGHFLLEIIELGELVTEMIHMLEVSISKKVMLRLNLTSDLPPVEVDATQIRQVLMNLVINASEAIGDNNGVIAITTGTIQCDSSYLSSFWLNDGLPEGLYVFIEVADTGCGMDSETIGKIFDPFFTTKFTGRGLGMAAVMGIVRGHHGAIKIYSEPGRGTTFKMLLPAAEGCADKKKRQSAENQLWQGTGLILIVDDEEPILKLGKEMLNLLGFEVLTASNGIQALKIFKKHSQEIKLVLLDMTMPQMDGEETFRELRRIKSDVRVVISSGYNEQDVSQRFLGKRLAGFIQKPYTLGALSDAIKKTLHMG